ncbi:MAG: phosphonoacetaldehyde hydrolase [Alphaproteobacteria bacterium]|nr:phosphonoacetaldehyde hydrolase [Alphaproteobacteria bacterium]MDE2041516.1 phosphonoacetaldehyde hydrolase [Alphaproteobacteria bacterium]MDE2340041.1 phosphonoacetaldehyde hydrolase [Alphaproteobacteria bacterium]
MTEAIRAVVFDWAGTMIDFGSCAPVTAMQHAFAQHQIEVSAELVRAHMGKAKRDHVEAILTAPETLVAWSAIHGTHPGRADGDAIYTALEPLMAQAAGAHTQLIPGAAAMAAQLHAQGIKIGSCTGYTRAMMADILPAATAQGYAPDCVVCAGETSEGRPSPLMLWKNLVALGVWPAHCCVKVDDAEVGMEEGRNAGCWAVGVSASGNAVGLDYEAYHALPEARREARIASASASLKAAGAHYVIESIADLAPIVADINARLARNDKP